MLKKHYKVLQKICGITIMGASKTFSMINYKVMILFVRSAYSICINLCIMGSLNIDEHYSVDQHACSDTLECVYFKGVKVCVKQKELLLLLIEISFTPFRLHYIPL